MISIAGIFTRLFEAILFLESVSSEVRGIQS